MRNIGIVGHEASKFTPKGEAEAKEIIRGLLSLPGDVLVSGHCHLGGIDIWAEEIAAELGRASMIFPPKKLQWSGGYRERNLQIAEWSHVVHCLAVVRFADSYKGMKFTYCYHCGTNDHIKGGGCWTMKQAKLKGRRTVLHLIQNPE